MSSSGSGLGLGSGPGLDPIIIVWTDSDPSGRTGALTGLPGWPGPSSPGFALQGHSSLLQGQGTGPGALARVFLRAGTSSGFTSGTSGHFWTFFFFTGTLQIIIRLLTSGACRTGPGLTSGPAFTWLPGPGPDQVRLLALSCQTFGRPRPGQGAQGQVKQADRLSSSKLFFLPGPAFFQPSSYLLRQVRSGQADSGAQLLPFPGLFVRVRLARPASGCWLRPPGWADQTGWPQAGTGQEQQASLQSNKRT